MTRIMDTHRHLFRLGYETHNCSLLEMDSPRMEMDSRRARPSLFASLAAGFDGSLVPTLSAPPARPPEPTDGAKGMDDG